MGSPGKSKGSTGVGAERIPEADWIKSTARDRGKGKIELADKRPIVVDIRPVCRSIIDNIELNAFIESDCIKSILDVLLDSGSFLFNLALSLIGNLNLDDRRIVFRSGFIVSGC